MIDFKEESKKVAIDFLRSLSAKEIDKATRDRYGALMSDGAVMIDFKKDQPFIEAFGRRCAAWGIGEATVYHRNKMSNKDIWTLTDSVENPK